MTSTEIGTLYKQYFRQLCLYALHYMGDLDESKDIVQECFASLIKNNPEISNSKVYLYNSVRNRCIDLLRSRKKERIAPMDDLSYISDEEAQRRYKAILSESRAGINMTPEELTKAYWELYNEVYSYRSIFKRTIFVKNFWRRPFTSFFYLGVNLFYRKHIKHGIVPNIV